jgi:hypothetical protein
LPAHQPDHALPKKRRITPLRTTLAVIPLLLAAAGFAAAAQAGTAPQPPQANPSCALAVPPDPLTAHGLATPYQLTATNRGDGPCHEANADQSAFVEAAIVDPATGALTVYRPLVVDAGKRPAIAPTLPTLPADAVVGVWFGSNGDTLTLRGPGLTKGNCVNGVNDSPFGQFAYCNAPAFFAAANKAVRAHRLAVPDVGTAEDGRPCPTTRDFGVVDQDQSDNVTTAYLITADGRSAQSSAANAKRLTGAQTLTNGSDNRLLDAFIDPPLGCAPFTAPDLTDNRTPTPSLALNELQAAAYQAAPVALIPPNDPMALVNGGPNTRKVNLYRAGVDQPVLDPRTDTARAYCRNLHTVGLRRLTTDHGLFLTAASPDSATGVGLFDFLTQRLQASFQELKC